jgi:hypothetical protein
MESCYSGQRLEDSQCTWRLLLTNFSLDAPFKLCATFSCEALLRVLSILEEQTARFDIETQVVFPNVYGIL